MPAAIPGERIEAHLKSLLVDGFVAYRLEFNEHASSYMTAKQEKEYTEERLARGQQYFSVFSSCTWLGGQEDIARAVKLNSVSTFAFSKADGTTKRIAASSMTRILTATSFAFQEREDEGWCVAIDYKLRGLIKGEFGEVSITYNDYKTSRMDPPCATRAEEFEVLGIDEEDALTLLKTGSVNEITWYPNTPIGSHTIRATKL